MAKFELKVNIYLFLIIIYIIYKKTHTLFK